MYDLSIVIPTCNRAELLRRGLASLRQDVQCSFEVIVVDGASEDGTGTVLAEFANYFGDRLKIIREDRREGFVRAANKGFRAAVGRNMIWLNDDARPLPGTLDEAVRQIDSAAADVAFLAMFHRFASERNVAFETTHDGKTFRLCHVRGTLYANFPIGRRQTYQRLEYFDERFYFLGADPDLSLKAWHAGMWIEPAHGCFIDHDEHVDERRAQDMGRGRQDNQKLFAKWDLPDKNLAHNDFDPERPCTLRGLAVQRPTVTFLISTHNRISALAGTLRQLQTLENSADFAVETVVVDNASTDGTAQAVKGEFPAVRLVRLRKNRGACAKNAGLGEARGEYVVFLDDDSYPDSESIRRMIEHFRARPRLGAAVFDVILPDGSRESSAFPSVCIGCGTGFRREALDAVGGLPDDFFMQAEEYDLSLRLLDAGWDIERFEDLRVSHLKTRIARQPARTTRLDVRNNLLVIARRFPRKWALPYAIDWMRRYRWMAHEKGWRHRAAFWRGLLEGMAKSLRPGRRRVVSDGAFEKFAMIEEIRCRLATAIKGTQIRSILLIDFGKNVYAYWLAARELKLNVVAIADANLARPGRQYRGIPMVDDSAARALQFDAAVVANVSPVHSLQRASIWRAMESRPVIDLYESNQSQAAAA
ncbi:MAG: glycosyltransferase family 2 protein [Tepidisphaeraceae bacterium]|jgi:GT2 family glycosyltransferase